MLNLALSNIDEEERPLARRNPCNKTNKHQWLHLHNTLQFVEYFYILLLISHLKSPGKEVWWLRAGLWSLKMALKFPSSPLPSWIILGKYNLLPWNHTDLSGKYLEYGNKSWIIVNYYFSRAHFTKGLQGFPQPKRSSLTFFIFTLLTFPPSPLPPYAPLPHRPSHIHSLHWPFMSCSVQVVSGLSTCPELASRILVVTYPSFK